MYNKFVVDGRNVGKTTFLLSEIDKNMSDNSRIIVLDSATEHEDKSLLKKVEKKYDDVVVLTPNNINDIVLNTVSIDEFIQNFTSYYPYNEIVKNKNKLICFDLSYFLELAHTIYDETNNEELYKYYRSCYNYLSEQIALIIILMKKYGIIDTKLVVMDEIEFPITKEDISYFQEDISFLAAVHPENAFGSFYESFEKADFKPYKPYVKRKDG